MKISLPASLLLSTLAFGCTSAFVGTSSFGVRPSAGFHSTIGLNVADQVRTTPALKDDRRSHKRFALNANKPVAEEQSKDQSKTFEQRNAGLIFSIIDVDGSGTLTKSELSDHLLQAGYPEKTVSQIFQKMDVNKDGEISQQEFEQGMMESLKALQTAPGLGSYNAQFVKEIIQDADQVFQSMDADNNGELDAFEVKSHMGRRWTSYSEKAIENLFAMLDLNGDEKISREEFRDAFLRHSALRQAIGEGPNYK